MIRALVLVVLLGGGTVWLPFLPVGRTGKGVAGPADSHSLFGVRAEWYHRWWQCSEGPACVSLYEGDYFSDAWIAADTCASGYVLLWNEPDLAWISYERQAQLVHRVKEILSSCTIVTGGWLAWSPQQGSGVAHPALLAAAYRRLYGVDAPIGGVHFHSYYFDGRDFAGDTRAMVQSIRAAFPGAEIWLTETGSLQGEAQAATAMGLLPAVVADLDRWAWFISSDRDPRPGMDWEFCQLWDSAGVLTALGRAYRQW